MSSKKSILIVDDSSVVRAAVRGLLRSHSEFEVSGEAANGQEALDIAERIMPDLVILDLSMPVMNGLEAAVLLIKLLPGVRLVLLQRMMGRRLSGKRRWLVFTPLFLRAGPLPR